MSRSRRFPVLNPNYGVYFDRTAISLDALALEDCLNIHLKNGRIVRDNMGWAKFLAQQLNGPVTLIDSFFPSVGGEILIFGTLTDLYQYDEDHAKALYITPIYTTGTLTATNGSKDITGAGTAWLANMKPGDSIFIGANNQHDPTASGWYTIDTVTNDTTAALTANFTGTTGGGKAYTLNKTFTANSIFEFWRTEVFSHDGASGDDLWFATNTSDPVVTWNGTDATVTVHPELGFTCRELLRFNNMMIYGNIEEGGEAKPFSIRNSAIGFPLNVTTGEASELLTHGGPDPIVALMTLGELMVVYSERSIVLAQFTTGLPIFIFRTAVDGIGPLTGRAIADFGDYHEFVGPDTQYRFDGAGLAESGQQVWHEIIRRRSPQRVDGMHAFFSEELGEVFWCSPQNTDADTDSGPPEIAYVEHYLEQVPGSIPTPYTIRQLPATSSGSFFRLSTLKWSDISDIWQNMNFRWNDQFFQSAFPLTLFGTNDGYVMQLGAQDSQDGGPIYSFARFGKWPMADIVRKGLLRRLYVFAERVASADYPLTVNVYTADQLAGPGALAVSLPYDLTQAGLRYVVPRIVGRFAQVEFTTTGVSHPFALQGYDVDVVTAGDR